MAVLSSRPSDEDVVDSSAGRMASGPDPGRCVATYPTSECARSMASAAGATAPPAQTPHPHPSSETHTQENRVWGWGTLLYAGYDL